MRKLLFTLTLIPLFGLAQTFDFSCSSYTKSYVNLRDEVFTHHDGYLPEDWRDIIHNREEFEADSIYSQWDFYDTSTWIDVFVADAARHNVDLNDFINSRDITITVNPRAGVWTGNTIGHDVIVTVGLQLLGEVISTIQNHGIQYVGGWDMGDVIKTAYHEIGHALLKYRHTCEEFDIMGGCYENRFPQGHARAGEYIPLEDGILKLHGMPDPTGDELEAAVSNDYTYFRSAVIRLFSGEGQLSDYAVYGGLVSNAVESPIAVTNNPNNRD